MIRVECQEPIEAAVADASPDERARRRARADALRNCLDLVEEMQAAGRSSVSHEVTLLVERITLDVGSPPGAVVEARRLAELHDALLRWEGRVIGGDEDPPDGAVVRRQRVPRPSWLDE